MSVFKATIEKILQEAQEELTTHKENGDSCTVDGNC